MRAFIDSILIETMLHFAFVAVACSDVDQQRLNFYVDVEKVENEFVLTSAQYLLSLANVKWTLSGKTYSVLCFSVFKDHVYCMLSSNQSSASIMEN